MHAADRYFEASSQLFCKPADAGLFGQFGCPVHVLPFPGLAGRAESRPARWVKSFLRAGVLVQEILRQPRICGEV